MKPLVYVVLLVVLAVGAYFIFFAGKSDPEETTKEQVAPTPEPEAPKETSTPALAEATPSPTPEQDPLPPPQEKPAFYYLKDYYSVAKEGGITGLDPGTKIAVISESEETIRASIDGLEFDINRALVSTAPPAPAAPLPVPTPGKKGKRPGASPQAPEDPQLAYAQAQRVAAAQSRLMQIRQEIGNTKNQIKSRNSDKGNINNSTPYYKERRKAIQQEVNALEAKVRQLTEEERNIVKAIRTM